MILILQVPSWTLIKHEKLHTSLRREKKLCQSEDFKSPYLPLIKIPIICCTVLKAWNRPALPLISWAILAPSQPALHSASGSSLHSLTQGRSLSHCLWRMQGCARSSLILSGESPVPQNKGGSDRDFKLEKISSTTFQWT